MEEKISATKNASQVSPVATASRAVPKLARIGAPGVKGTSRDRKPVLAISRDVENCNAIFKK